jgi:hypothetical protein
MPHFFWAAAKQKLIGQQLFAAIQNRLATEKQVIAAGVALIFWFGHVGSFLIRKEDSSLAF